jgi:trans-aconitate 2-methyltransferase
MTDWNAEAYQRVSALQQWLAEKSIAGLALRGDERVLDVGCGDGRISAALAERLPRGSVIGVDASQDMVTFAARSFPTARHPNLAFQRVDAARLGFADAFDLVVSFNCLHWVRDQAAALRGIRAALAPSGRTHLRLVARGTRPSLEAVIEETRHAPRWTGCFADYETPYVHLTPEDYRALAERCGLCVERLDVQDETWDFHSPTAFAAFAAATFVEWTRRIPAERRQAFIADVLARYGQGTVFRFYQMEAALARA